MGTAIPLKFCHCCILTHSATLCSLSSQKALLHFLPPASHRRANPFLSFFKSLLKTSVNYSAGNKSNLNVARQLICFDHCQFSFPPSFPVFFRSPCISRCKLFEREPASVLSYSSCPIIPLHSKVFHAMQSNYPEGFSCEGNGLHNLFHVGSWSGWEWVRVPANSSWFQATQWPVQTRNIILTTHCLHLRLVWFQSSFQTQSQQRQHQIHWSQHQTPTDFQLGWHPQLDRHVRVTSAQRNCCSGHGVLCGYHHGNLITHQT